MNRSTEIEVKVGIFMAIGLGLFLFTILFLSGGQSIFDRSNTFYVNFKEVDGLIEGAVVKVSGIKVGKVEQIRFLKESAQIQVSFTVARKFKDAIRKDSTVGIQTQGVLGDRYLVVKTESSQSPLAENGDELPSEPAKELKDYLNNADEVLARLKNSLTHIETIVEGFRRNNRSEIFFRNVTELSTSLNSGTQNLPVKMKEVYAAMEHLRSIFSKIDQGQGTLGALINDPSLYEDLKALLGGANRNRVLKYFIKKSVEDSREAAEQARETREAASSINRLNTKKK